MSEEMKIREIYQQTFNEVHAPEGLSRKVMNMAKMEQKKTKAFARKGLIAAAAALAIIVGGNGVAYAATGSSLLKNVMIYIDGAEHEMELEEKTDENGDTYYEGTYELENGEASITISGEEEAKGVQIEIEEETEGADEASAESIEIVVPEEE